MTNNYAKVKTGRGWVFMFFDDRDHLAVASAIERSTELGFSRIAVWKKRGLVRQAIISGGFDDGVLEVGDVPAHLADTSEESAV